MVVMVMRRTAVSACLIALCLIGSAAAQNNKNTKFDAAAIEREIKAFYDSYSEDLLKQRGAAIAERYDPRGAYAMGNGRKSYQSAADLKKKYLAFTAPKHFAWKDLSIDVISADTVAVLGLFEWQTTGQINTYSYTGLLIKRDGKWLIRVEDESRGVNPPPVQ